MKKVSLMVVAALLSASMFANSASLPKKGATVNGTKPKTETSKSHKQKDKQKAATPKTKEQKVAQKSSKKAKGTK
ncbi:MAG TPA: hypothetical protein VNX01_02490 [Bacteroidia bacterium]|jgi:hypothetical protein|nr:hypothetical protein [Bacteroidia bacterium]